MNTSMEEEDTYGNVLATDPGEEDDVDEYAFDAFGKLLQNLAYIINTQYNGDGKFSLTMNPPSEGEHTYIFTIVEFLETQKDPKHLKRMDPDDFSRFLRDFEDIFHQYPYNAGIEKIDMAIPDIFIDYEEDEEMLVSVYVPHLLCLHGIIAALASRHDIALDQLPNNIAELNAECEEILGQWIMENAPRSLQQIKYAEMEGP